MNSLGSLLLLSAVVAVVPLCACSGCGKESPSSGGETPSTSSARNGATSTPPSASSAPKQLPAAIAASKKIRVGSDISYPPVEYYKDGTKEVQGLDADICDALAKKLGDGIACDFQNDDFDKLLPDLAANKYDLVMSAMSDNADRQKKVDFIDYFRAAMGVLIKKGNPLKLKSLNDICGKSLGAQRGTTEEIFAQGQKVSCANAGLPPLTIVAVTSDNDSVAMLKAGKLAADLEDQPAAAYEAKTSGGGNDFELLETVTGRTPYGMAIPKGNIELRAAFVGALEAIIADETYLRILEKWGLRDGAVTAAVVNGG